MLGGIYKYVCIDLTDDIPEQRHGYKEVTYVGGYHAVMVRIRWAKSHMSNREFRAAHEKGDPFFTVPEAELLEYPGYVYHCHILIHEDNEMMRPIMMQPHVYADGSRQNQPWSSTLEELNQQNCPAGIREK